MSRKKNSARNIMYALISQIVLTLIQFISRRIFIDYLGIEYLGINGLFTNIISILSLTELGIGTAIIYSLYKTIATNNDYATAALLNFYKKVYTYIMIVVALIGVSIFPFLDVFIKGKPNIPNVNYYYLFFLVSTIISYFSAYKSSIIIAKQKQYVVTFYEFVTSVTIQVVQVIALIITKNFTVFLIINLIGVFIKNFAITKYVHRAYPELVNTDSKIDSAMKSEISKNIKGMLFQKIGGVMTDSTDNIIISSFLGINYVGLYSNYFMIILALRKIIDQIFTPLTASLGNLCIVDNKEKAFEVFNTIFFINFWLVSYVSIGILSSINHIVAMWIGSKYILGYDAIILITLNFYLKCIRQTLIIFKNANGLYWEERYKGIAEASANLIASLILVNIFGFIGVLIGTAFSTITTVLWIEPYILYKNYFKKYSLLDYFKKYIVYFIIFVVLSIVCILLNNILFNNMTSLNILGRILLCTLIVNSFYIALFYKTKEFKYLKYNVLNIMKQVKFKN